MNWPNLGFFCLSQNQNIFKNILYAVLLYWFYTPETLSITSLGDCDQKLHTVQKPGHTISATPPEKLTFL